MIRALMHDHDGLESLVGEMAVTLAQFSADENVENELAMACHALVMKAQDHLSRHADTQKIEVAE